MIPHNYTCKSILVSVSNVATIQELCIMFNVLGLIVNT